MSSPSSAPSPARDRLLFTPGPLTTSARVKEAMLHDAGSWHWEFNAVVKSVRDRLLALAGLSTEAGWECIPLQGSGSFGIEAVLTSVIPPQGKVLVHSNGAYGERALLMLQRHHTPHAALRTAEDTPPTAAQVEAALAADPAISHVLMVHCETTTGVLNPLDGIGPAVKRTGRVFIVDAMSSFGACPVDFAACGIDYLVSSANKCIEGVPGFSFIFARRADLEATAGWARVLSLDLLDQLKGFDRNGQFRYTPPTHAILAFDRALEELAAEGGVPARMARYQRNHAALLRGMTALGFRPFLPPEVQSHIITSFVFPADPKFTFAEFYRRVAERGFILYPGKISQADTFRIGNIGRIFEGDIEALVDAIGRVVREMGLKLTAP